MLKNYLQTAWRHLTHHKTWAITNVAGLCLGLASVMLILLFVKDEISFDRFQTRGQHLYRLVHEAMDPTGTEEKGGTSAAPQAAAFLQSIPGIEAACRISSGSLLVKKDGDVIPETPLYADSNFFHVFSFHLLSGNAALALKREDDIVLSEDMARKYFNTTNAVGRTLEINTDGKFETFTVSAIAANAPVNSSIRFDFVLPMQRQLHAGWTREWTNSFLNTFFVLRPDADVKAVENKMTALFMEHTSKLFAPLLKQYPNIYYRYKLQPFLSMHLDKTYNANNGINHWSDASYSYTLGGIAFFILLIACINFVNLTLARSLRRGKEIGIRKVSGGTRGQLIAQFMGESLLLNCLAFLPAFALVRICLPWFAQLANKELSVSYLFHTPNLLIFAGLILVNTILSGSYPALVMSGFNPIQTLYGKFRFAGKNLLGKSLVVLQFSLVIFLIVGTLVMQRQFRFMLNEDPGYQTTGVVNVSLPDADNQHLNLLQNELAKYPVIRQTAAQSIDFTNSNTTFMKVNGHDFDNVPFYKMDENALSLLHIPIVAGRDFFTSTSDSNACIINQSMAHASGWKEPIGQHIDWNNQHFTVVGIVRDFHMASMRKKISPAFICHSRTLTYGNLLVKIDDTQKAAAIAAIQTVYHRVYLEHPLDYGFLDNMLADQYKSEQRWKNIVAIAAMLAVFISCMGLFGLAALAIEQRTREIGIRKVLGANTLSITRLLSTDFIQLVLLAFIIASPVAWYFFHHWLQDFAYRIELSWNIFLTVGALMAGIALLTVGFRSARAAMTNPAHGLRNE